MSSIFDTIIDRHDTDSIKYDFATHHGKPQDVLPLWVADMDFRAPEPVLAALAERSRHGIFGYSEAGQAYFDAVQGWFSRRFDWDVQTDWLVKTPGVVLAICTAIRSLTSKGDSVLIQQPVYHPFAESVLVNGRRLTVNQLVEENGRYRIDFADFEARIVRDRVQLFILCSPHNPVGRIWSEDELTRMGDICFRHGVTVIADEIHADFVFPGRRHLVFANLRPEYRDMTVTCTAPTKTFNLAGLQVSNIFIANPDIRRRFSEELKRSGAGMVGIMGLVACQAAYLHGDAWLEELREYLTGNLDLLRSFLQKRLPKIRLVEPDGTYLAWLDCRQLGLGDEDLNHRILNEARLLLNAGPMFGTGGEGFQRINIACPRQILHQALEQLSVLGEGH